MNTVALYLFFISIAVVVYHHIGYPLLLNLITKNKKIKRISYFKRNYQPTLQDKKFPSICIVIPACNEQKYIVDKIINLAILDYPQQKLSFILICDGCTDNTEKYAKNTVKELGLANFNIIINATNQGKIYSLNKAISQSIAEIIVLTDTSAIMSIDSLLLIAAQLKRHKIGAISSKYKFIDASIGESSYWRYQTNVKSQESCLASTMGAHGACYAIKRKLFNVIPQDIINDDFWIPVKIISQGYRCIYDDRIIAVELEPETEAINFKRRIRISLGNMQQAIKFISLLHYNNKIAFLFFSGKFLRAFVPLFFICLLVSAAFLSQEYWVFMVFSISFASVLFCSSIYLLLNKTPKIKIIKRIHHFICSYIAITIGCLKYLFSLKTNIWKKQIK
jgi:cellulose synthase/poly-beta-1,6-N-acetylglucosamine synthase-like glycosyltransferase